MKSKKKKISIIRSIAAEYLTFVTASGEGGVEAIYADENVWLTQKMMAALYIMPRLPANTPRHSLKNTALISNVDKSMPSGKYMNTTIPY